MSKEKERNSHKGFRFSEEELEELNELLKTDRRNYSETEAEIILRWGRLAKEERILDDPDLEIIGNLEEFCLEHASMTDAQRIQCLLKQGIDETGWKHVEHILKYSSDRIKNEKVRCLLEGVWNERHKFLTFRE